MLIDIFFGFILGTCSFTADNCFPELFLEKCRERGITLRDISVDEKSVTASCSDRNYRLAVSLSAEQGNDMITLSRRGLPFILERYRKRAGIPVGILLSVLIFTYLSSRIWEINIVGNERVPDVELMETLEENGIKKGKRVSSADEKAVADAVVGYSDEIAWAALSFSGCKATLEIIERKKDITDPFLGKICNIVAAKSGEIVKADILKGEGKLLPGTPVVKGDLLVSGVRENVDGKTGFISADAVITAKTKNVISSGKIADTGAIRRFKCKDNYLLRFFGAGIPLGIFVKENCFTKTGRYFCSENTVFPVGIEQYPKITAADGEAGLSENEAELMRCSDFADLFFDSFYGVEVESFTVSRDEKGKELTGNVCCLENICEKKAIIIDKNK